MVGATVIGIMVIDIVIVSGCVFGNMAICTKSGPVTATATTNTSIKLT